MIRTENEEINYKTKFSNGEHSAFSDTTIDKWGVIQVLDRMNFSRQQ